MLLCHLFNELTTSSSTLLQQENKCPIKDLWPTKTQVCAMTPQYDNYGTH